MRARLLTTLIPLLMVACHTPQLPPPPADPPCVFEPRLGPLSPETQGHYHALGLSLGQLHGQMQTRLSLAHQTQDGYRLRDAAARLTIFLGTFFLGALFIAALFDLFRRPTRPRWPRHLAETSLQTLASLQAALPDLREHDTGLARSLNKELRQREKPLQSKLKALRALPPTEPPDAQLLHALSEELNALESLQILLSSWLETWRKPTSDSNPLDATQRTAALQALGFSPSPSAPPDGGSDLPPNLETDLPPNLDEDLDSNLEAGPATDLPPHLETDLPPNLDEDLDSNLDEDLPPNLETGPATDLPPTGDEGGEA